MVNLSHDDINKLIELREAAREVYASAGVFRMQGANLIRSDMAVARLFSALTAVDCISFKPVAKPKVTRK